MELKDTIELMNSSDWKDRFKAEYLQTEELEIQGDQKYIVN